MADLSDIKAAGDEIVPIIKDLVARIREAEPKTDTSGELAVIRKLQRVADQSAESTPASLEQRANAIVAGHTALTDLLIAALTDRSIVDEARLVAIRVQRDALGESLGMLLQRAAFEPIAQLLDAPTLQEINSTLQKADEEIRRREEARALLDNVINVTTAMAKIATRVATL